MVREFLEIDDLSTFIRVAEQSPLVIRKDPFLFAQYYAMMFFINLTTLKEGDVRRLFELLKSKTVIVKSMVEASSLSEFIKMKE
ncbi:hypothetical protein DRO55_01175 [Candidatus Bathyarchaeota archaeon]|nr:MAG: hypothetical protein DRO55_01175 [Candidatus Bathyarchaeota archaeon]